MQERGGRLRISTPHSPHPPARSVLFYPPPAGPGRSLQRSWWWCGGPRTSCLRSPLRVRGTVGEMLRLACPPSTRTNPLRRLRAAYALTSLKGVASRVNAGHSHKPAATNIAMRHRIFHSLTRDLETTTALSKGLKREPTSSNVKPIFSALRFAAAAAAAAMVAVRWDLSLLFSRFSYPGPSEFEERRASTTVKFSI